MFWHWGCWYHTLMLTQTLHQKPTEGPDHDISAFPGGCVYPADPHATQVLAFPIS